MPAEDLKKEIKLHEEDSQENTSSDEDEHPQYSLKWNNHQSHILTAFDALFKAETLVDVSLVCAEMTIRAHKVVLSACSPFFQKIFSDTPCKHPVIVLNDYKSWEIQAIIDFMYKGEISVDQIHLSSLIKAAESLQVRGLARKDELLSNNSLSVKSISKNELSNLQNDNHVSNKLDENSSKLPHMTHLNFTESLIGNELSSSPTPRRKQARPRRRSGEFQSPQDLSKKSKKDFDSNLEQITHQQGCDNHSTNSSTPSPSVDMEEDDTDVEEEENEEEETAEDLCVKRERALSPPIIPRSHSLPPQPPLISSQSLSINVPAQQPLPAQLPPPLPLHPGYLHSSSVPPHAHNNPNPPSHILSLPTIPIPNLKNTPKNEPQKSPDHLKNNEHIDFNSINKDFRPSPGLIGNKDFLVPNLNLHPEAHSPLPFPPMPNVSSLAMTPPHIFGLDSPLGLFPPGMEGCRNPLLDLNITDPRNIPEQPPLFTKKKMGRPKGQHSAPRGGPPRSWTNAELTEALQHVWNKKMTTSQASRIFGIPYNSLLMYVRGKYGKSLKLEQLRKDCEGSPGGPLDLLSLSSSNNNNNNNTKIKGMQHENDNNQRPPTSTDSDLLPGGLFNPFPPPSFYPDFVGFPLPMNMLHLLPHPEAKMERTGESDSFKSATTDDDAKSDRSKHSIDDDTPDLFKITLHKDDKRELIMQKGGHD